MRVVALKWEFVHDEVEPTLWVDLRRFDLIWQQSDDYIGLKGAGSSYGAHRYNKVGAFIRQHQLLFYPVISLRDGIPVFTDGRHRTAWLRDHNTSAIPVICSEEDADSLGDRCGTNERQTFFQDTDFFKSVHPA